MAPVAQHPGSERDRILVLDYGSQYTQLIARRIREQHVYCEIHPADVDLDAIRAWEPDGVILSGGPASVLDEGAPDLDPRIAELGKPVLGICYGLQLWPTAWAAWSRRPTTASTGGRCSRSSATIRSSRASRAARSAWSG